MFDFDESLTYSVPVGGTYGNGIDTLTGRPIFLSSDWGDSGIDWGEADITNYRVDTATFPNYIYTFRNCTYSELLGELFAVPCGVGEDCDDPMEETDELINYLREIRITDKEKEGDGK